MINSTTKMLVTARRALRSVAITQVSALSARNLHVLATDGIDESCAKIFESRGHTVDLIANLNREKLLQTIHNYDALVVRSATKVNAEVFAAGKRLKAVGRAGVGVDNIDLKEATKHGVIVLNTPGGNTVSTAQLAMSLLLSVARKIPVADMSIKQDKWDRKLIGVELRGKTLGVVGCGRIGQVVASCAQSLGMKVIGYDPIASKEDLAENGIVKETFDNLIQKSDFITVHTPLTKDTQSLFNDTTLARCKKGVYLVNAARGGIIDEDALLRALESGHVAGAALDVFTTEPPKENLQRLLNHPNLVCTPHLGASTEEAQLNVAKDIASQMCDVFENRDFVGIVNVPYLQASTNPHMKPFMKLAETIGSIAVQLSPASKVTEISVQTWGGRDVDITTKSSRQLLEAMVLSGVLRSLGNTAVDFISAPMLACEQQIVVKALGANEVPALAGPPYWNLVSVEAKRADGTTTRVTGSVFGTSPHIVAVDSFQESFSFKPEASHLLTFRNLDQPGAISVVLKHLADAKVNVASVNVARPSSSVPQQQQKALCFMSVDDDIPEKTLRTLQSLSMLSDVAKIKL